MGHRYYDPRTGRFISQDPAGSGDNWYVYADNNPVNNVDPSGLYATWPGDGIPFPQPELGSVIDSLPDGTYNLYISNNGGKDSTYLRTITVGTGFVHSLGGGGAGTVIMTSPGHVGHTDDNDTFGQKIKELLKKRHGGGLTSQERAALDKEINDLQGKINTNEKASKQRGSRASRFVFNPTPMRVNPILTVPTVSPAQAGGMSVTVTAIVLLVIKILSTPIPVP